jgi:antitoxin component of MazEF toxin-antitoxin module
MIAGRIRKVGNSLVVTVPRAEAEALELREGDLVTLEIRRAEIRPVLRPDLRGLAEESWERNQSGYHYLADH